LELLAQQAGISFERRVPGGKDWNDDLMGSLAG
jgi:hypothetical protein